MARRARVDPNAYIEYVMKDNRGDRLVQESLHETWHAHIAFCRSRDRFAGILAPFGHGKTVQVLGLITYIIGRIPEIRIKIVCNSDENAKLRVAKARDIIATDPDFHRTFPGVEAIAEPGRPRGDWARHAFRVRSRSHSIDPTLAAHGIFATGIGGRADIIVFDDPLDLRNTIEYPSMRAKVIESIRNVWLSRLVEDGFAIYICTRWHEDDATGKLMVNERWGWLVQRVTKDYGGIESELLLPGWKDPHSVPPISRVAVPAV